MSRPVHVILENLDADKDGVADDCNITGGTIDGVSLGATTPIPTLDVATLDIGGVTVTSTAAELNILDGVTATATELNNAADVSARTQELLVTGAVTSGVQSVELNDASTIIAATIASASNHQGLFIVKDTSASGTAAHTLTLTSGTFDGTATIATLNAPDEALIVYFDSAGNGTIVENVGAVALS